MATLKAMMFYLLTSVLSSLPVTYHMTSLQHKAVSLEYGIYGSKTKYWSVGTLTSLGPALKSGAYFSRDTLTSGLKAGLVD